VTVDLSRRAWLMSAPAAVGAGLAAGLTVAPMSAPAKERDNAKPFRYSLNTSTIRGQKLTLEQEIDVAAKAGYDCFEPWVSELDDYTKKGGSLEDLGKRLRDRGLSVESSIGFFEWIVDDPERRKKGLEAARHSMDLVRKIGGKRIAAPPWGATKQTGLNLLSAAERYRALLELGDKMEVVPQAEVWGFSTTLTRLGEAAQVAIEAGHPRACILADVYHLHKGGSGFGGLHLLGAAALQIFHMNDYPADPPRERISDSDRVYPGDGVAPLKPMLRDLRTLGFQGVLSLELFNREYWKQDALNVAQTGLEKMRAVVAASQEGN
jgi:sugar phosphate isomerase/epimerase